MARIKVTGFLDTKDMAPDEVDLDHEMGLSEKGHIEWSVELATLDDLEFKLVG